MRFHFSLVVFILFLAYFPACVWQLQRCNKATRTGLTVLVWAIPTLFLIGFGCIGFRWVNVEHIFMIWFVWLFFTLFIPGNIMALFTAVDKLVEHWRKKTFIVCRCIGYPLAVLLFVGLIWGAVDRKQVSVHRVDIVSEALPQAFNNLKIVQISDVHLGNLDNAELFLEQIKDKINAEKPDLIMLTGDLVNFTSEEGIGLEDNFVAMEAAVGKFAVLGNHDYGDYLQWPTVEAKMENLEKTKALYCRCGFDLLLDEHRIISKNSARIGIVGVGNCGKAPFPCYGNLPTAVENVTTNFNIFLSHDPTHWRSEILHYPQLTLTLAGHTHAAQMGVDVGKWRFSPSQWVYDEWDGLYREHDQFLFVNRGLGYVGIPFRLGMPPEITVITLKTFAE
jgi:uncharacterized protein